MSNYPYYPSNYYPNNYPNPYPNTYYPNTYCPNNYPNTYSNSYSDPYHQYENDAEYEPMHAQESSDSKVVPKINSNKINSNKINSDKINSSKINSSKINLSKSINVGSSVKLLPEQDKEYVLWLRQQNKETKAKIRERNNSSNEKIGTPKASSDEHIEPKEKMNIIVKHERIKTRLDRKLRLIRYLFDKETLDKIKSIKELYKPVDDYFIETAKSTDKYVKPNTKYYNLDIETFIKLLEYFELPYEISDIIALYENPGNQPENDTIQNELLGISTIIQLCIRLDIKYKRRNTMFIQICNCDPAVIPSLSDLYGILDDTIVIPLYFGVTKNYNHHLQAVGIDPSVCIEDEGMYDRTWDVCHIFLKIVNNLPEEKSKKYFN